MLSASADTKHVHLAISASGPERSNPVVTTLRVAMPCDHGFESAGRTSSWTIGFPKDQMISEGIPGAYTAALGPSCRWQSLRWALRRARHALE